MARPSRVPSVSDQEGFDRGLLAGPTSEEVAGIKALRRQVA